MKTAFTDKQLEEAIDRVHAGEKLAAVADSSPVSLSTLKRKVAARIEGRSIERQRPGPAPLLPPECEADLVTWIAAMQRRLVRHAMVQELHSKRVTTMAPKCL
ncbi:hypothetical protein PHYSODRAFT_331378 [Phytophthora sojae]|uniref:HTH psq-type domain-containing protein n=1 Tax=Phytophthora sojae (strain P6497) TaxID=1094619 RepID=G4ZE46_PHYSP|nr:hypothetical protein PHYSODRAFT_331378 [Phytophthora sojae]EGZ17397.1 hypothetical protein PHYSODRAFT_331378 [Phytophthora sojae]|eukprot:XP_009526455.1 hypothetical protein PHYSODRAFT_331378 [Phytophthora sojae]